MTNHLQNSNSDDSTSEAYDEGRPNRWTGAPTTWLSITEQERGLAGSLNELRNRDLSVHLYNAHKLRKRGRDLQRMLDEGVKINDPLASDAEEPFIPPKLWTAWPLPPNEVPRTGEKIGEEDPDEVFTFKRREITRPSRELEDVLMGIAMKSAKERFQARKWESEDDGQEGPLVDIVEEAVSQDEGYANENGIEGEDEELHAKDEPNQEPKEIFIPAISADDERSAEILRPTIRHSLSKLDELLTALHHARNTCRRYSFPSMADSDSDNASVHSSKRLRGRPRNFELPHRSKPGEADVVVEDEGEGLRQKSGATRRRRPLKLYPRSEGESNQDYLERIAKLQKKPLPSFAKSRETSSAPSHSPEKVASVPRQNRADPDDAAKSHRGRLGLRDWSEVLGAAALVGFPPDALARATQRCATLFGEGMVMRTMVEAPFGVQSAKSEKVYRPDVIPDFDNDNEDEGECEEDEGKQRIDSDLEMEGSVHVDRFLRVEERALRGPDIRVRKKPRRKKKVTVKGEEDKDGDGDEEEGSEDKGDPEPETESSEAGENDE